jgi:tyrosine-protein kinase Etk/Wzc
LKVVPSGVLPPNPAELLATKKMEDLLSKLQEDFDIVIIDSPPVIAVTDASILSTKVDGTLLVVYAGQTERDAVKRATSMLTSVSARILGIVLNGFDVQGIYGSYYYYYYHHYYGESKKKRNRLFGR